MTSRPHSGWCRRFTITTRSAIGRTRFEEEASTWTAIFDDKFKGKTGLNVDPLIAFGQAVLAMNSLGLLQVPNPGNPDKKSIDEASKFLISKKKNGQFRALWGDFGELVNLLASGEMILADAWQPAVMAVKAQGKQCTYAVPKEGYRAWSIGISDHGNANKEAVIAYADYWLSGPPAASCPNRATIRRRRTSRKSCRPKNTPSGTRESPGGGHRSAESRKGDLRDGGSLESARRPSPTGTSGLMNTTT